jgi:excisionase family DNA binding protein
MKKLWTVEELCESTSLEKRTVYYLLATRKIPFVKLTERILRFDPEAIQNWIEERTHGTSVRVTRRPVR